jgi:hypothetical protein
MIRIALIAVATLATIATASPAAAGARVRTLGPADLGSSDTVSNDTAPIAEPKAAPCADESCAGKPLSRCHTAPAIPLEAALIHASRCGKRPKTA